MKIINKLFLMLLVIPTFVFYGIDKKNWVFNKTNKTMTIKFYKNGGYAGKVLVGFDLILPYTSKVGQSIDMHSLSSDNMILYYDNLKTSMPTPSIGDLRDYEISIENNQLFLRQLDSIMGIPTGSHENRNRNRNNDSTPAVPETSEQKLDRLKKENVQLQADNKTRQEHIDKLSNDITRLRKKGAVGPMNSRKDERAKEDDKIKANVQKIAENTREIEKLKIAIEKEAAAKKAVQKAAKNAKDAVKTAVEKAVAEKTTTDKSASDKAASDKAASDKSAASQGTQAATPAKRLTLQHRLDRLKKENAHLQAENKTRQEHMDKLSNDIKRLRKKGAVGPMNSRKDERAKEDDKIKLNDQKIAENNREIEKIKLVIEKKVAAKKSMQQTANAAKNAVKEAADKATSDKNASDKDASDKADMDEDDMDEDDL